jgi:uncharacterized protein YraI
MKHFNALGILAAALLIFASVAQAQVAYTTRTANLHAGPDRDYPLVVILPSGYEISVIGCLSDYTWCDVLAGQDRGWIYAGNISYPYEDTYVPVQSYGPELGIGIVGFFIDDYWTDHYRERPWYRERHRWMTHSLATRHEPNHSEHHEGRQHPPDNFPMEHQHQSQSLVQPLPQPLVPAQSQPFVQPLAHPLAPPNSQPLVRPLAHPLVQPLAHPLVQPLAQPLVQPLAQPVVPAEGALPGDSLRFGTPEHRNNDQGRSATQRAKPSKDDPHVRRHDVDTRQGQRAYR